MEPFLRPWMGEGYLRRRSYFETSIVDHADAAALSIHFLGESHYCQDDSWDEDFTVRVVRQHAAVRQPAPLFRKLANATADSLGNEPEPNGKDFWGKVAYSNFIQQPLSRPRAAVPSSFWEEARHAFLAQLKIVRPWVVIVFGWRTWQNLPLERALRFKNIRAVGHDGLDLPEVLFYTYRNGDELQMTTVVPIAHPSGRAYRRAEAAGRIQTAYLMHCGLSGEDIVQQRAKAVLERGDDAVGFAEA